MLLSLVRRGSAFRGPIFRASTIGRVGGSTPVSASSRLFTSSDSDGSKLYSTANPPRNGEIIPDVISDEIDAVLQGSQVLEEIPSPTSDELDLSNPAHLSTLNPRWIKAGLNQKVIDVLSNKTITSFTPVQAEVRRPSIRSFFKHHSPTSHRIVTHSPPLPPPNPPDPLSLLRLLSLPSPDVT